MPRDPFKDFQDNIDESFGARFKGVEPKTDLLSTFAAGGSTKSPAPSQSNEPDLLGAWTSIASPAAVPKPMAETTPSDGPERPGQAAARWVAEHQSDSFGDKAARLGAGAFRGVGDVADTLAQAVTATGERGANVLGRAGVLSPDTVGAVKDWHDRINKDIGTDNALYAGAGGNNGLAGVGQVVGQIAASAPLLGVAGRAAMAPVNALTRAAPSVAQTLAAPGNALRVGQLALGGAGVGAGTAALTSATSDDPLADQIKGGATAGAVLGPLGAGAARLGSKLVGGVMDQETATLAKAARDKFGIPIGIGQMSENPTVRFMDSVMQRLPFTGMAARTAEQQTSLNQAVAKEMGIGADKITPQVVQTALTKIGREYDSINSRIGTLNLDPQFVHDLQNIKTNAGYNLEPAIAQRIGSHIDNIISKVDPRTLTMDPKNYQYLTRKDGPLGKALAGGDSGVRQYAGDLKESLESLVARNNPSLAAEKNAADYKYFVAKSVQQMADDAPTGNVSPAKLLKAVDSSHTDVGELGRIARRFMVEPPSSGTAERYMIMQHLPQLAIGATGLGGLAGAAYFDPESWQRNALLAGGALTAGRIGGAALKSNLLANSAIRSGLRGPGPANALGSNVSPLLAMLGALKSRQNALAPSP